jgi:hypothetical protein
MDGKALEIGRVLRANTTGFAVGCRVNQLTDPGFGSLVKACPAGSREAIYGLIYDINIDDDQLIRRLVMVENPRPEVIEDQRSNRLLPIEMSVMAIGYETNSNMVHSLPPRPPLNLDPVVLCQDAQEVKKFTDDLGYLRLILRGAESNLPVAQLLVAHLNDIYEIRGQDVGWVNKALAELIDLLRSNYEVLIPTLEALSDALPELEVSQ